MIPCPYQWQDHNGASHRKNLDTPPLKGLRMEPFRFQWETCINNGAGREKLNLRGSIRNRDCKWDRRQANVHRHT